MEAVERRGQGRGREIQQGPGEVAHGWGRDGELRVVVKVDKDGDNVKRITMISSRADTDV